MLKLNILTPKRHVLRASVLRGLITIARACHYGRRISFSGRPQRNRLACQVAATYVPDDVVSMIFAKIRYLLDSKSTHN